MTKQYYECHVTMSGNKEAIKKCVEKLKWKFSCIDGDPTLGDGLKCYATRHFNHKLKESAVLNELHRIADSLVNSGIEVLRRKIERVIYDDRSSTVRLDACNGLCPECHLDDIQCRNFKKN